VRSLEVRRRRTADLVGPFKKERKTGWRMSEEKEKRNAAAPPSTTGAGSHTRASPSMFAVFLGTALTLLVGTSHADVRVLVFGGGDQAPAPSLVDALRIHLARVARVETVETPLNPGPLSSKLSQVQTSLEQAQATFAVWLDVASELKGMREFVLYVVGGTGGRAVVQMVRIPAERDGPEVERALALKVTDIIEAALSSRRDAGADLARALPPANASSAELRVPAPPKESAPRAVAWRLGLGVGVAAMGPSGNAGPQGAGRASVMAVASLRPVDLESFVAFEMPTPSRAEGAAGSMQVSEQAAFAGMRVLSKGALQLGAELEGGSRWLHAAGSTPDGSRGEVSKFLPLLRAAPVLRLPVGERMGLSFSLGLEWMMIRQRFAVDDVVVLDLGRARASACISFVISGP
jgi:hypothetical protein